VRNRCTRACQCKGRDGWHTTYCSGEPT